jgi:hypothetical protein
MVISTGLYAGNDINAFYVSFNIKLIYVFYRIRLDYSFGHGDLLLRCELPIDHENCPLF